ncbi:hypothetical protein NC653_003455 [Populus alba x Populus x berolinensis]|uniref:Transcription and mRNA export factor ENY2 n=1 Tax=Populus alba x Populus x berolinensis TaxID=444605 RepID=A0AAD6RRM0_9ROSI|nr:hypothetical protein NC653_003455 [Populus alba x Populus x berolinensis]
MRNSVNRPPTPDDTAEEEEEKQPSLHETINIKLIESGEKERLTELLRERLIECGWKDEMKALCRIIRCNGRSCSPSHDGADPECVLEFSHLLLRIYVPDLWKLPQGNALDGDAASFWLNEWSSLSGNLCSHAALHEFWKAFIKKKGRNNVTVDDLVHVITPKGRGRAVAENPFFSRSSCCLIRQSNFLNYVVVGKLKLMNGMEALFTIVLSGSLEKWRQLRFTLNIYILQNEGNGISVCASGLNEGSSSYSLQP